MLDESVDGFDESLGHGHRLFGGGKAVAEVAPAEGGDSALSSQLGHVSVEIHPVDALQFHDDVFFLELGQAVG